VPFLLDEEDEVDDEEDEGESAGVDDELFNASVALCVNTKCANGNATRFKYVSDAGVCRCGPTDVPSQPGFPTSQPLAFVASVGLVALATQFLPSHRVEPIVAVPEGRPLLNGHAVQ
jgi:hypothetical protein